MSTRRRTRRANPRQPSARLSPRTPGRSSRASDTSPAPLLRGSAPTPKSVVTSRAPLRPPRNSLPSCFPPFMSVALKRLSTHAKRASSLRCQKRTALPRRSLLARLLRPPGLTGEHPCAPRLLSSRRVRNPSALSSSFCGRHHPVPHKRTQDCLALALAADAHRAHQRSYSDLLPCLRRFNHLADSRGTEEPPSAAATVPRLVLLFVHSVTSLGAYAPGHLALRASARTPQFPSAAIGIRFLGAGARNSPLPSSKTLLAVWHRLRMH